MEQELRATAAAKEWLGHPRGLTILFLTEMWTQFSMYGMRALLVYYMTKELAISQTHSSLIYGAYGAAVFFTPIVGGVLSDRYLGKRNAVVIGAVLMAVGHFMMAVDRLFYPGLAAIAAGNGFLLPSLSSQINSLYDEEDSRLSSAYSVYYVGINIGAFLAPLVCGSLGELFGWHWGFGAAGVGMLLAIAIYLYGMRYLPEGRRETSATHVVFRNPEHPRSRLALFLGIMLVVVVFRGAYEQVGNTIALWADSGVDRHITANVLIPVTWFQALNPLLIFLLTPPLVLYWSWRARRGRERSSLARMASGALIVAFSYLMIAAIASWSSAHDVRASWVYLALFFFVMTAGELFILPVGLGFFGKTAPQGYTATAIAIWFFAGFAGNLLAGSLGTLWSVLAPGTYFALIALVAAAAAALLLMFLGPASRAERESPQAVPVPAPL